MLGLYLHIPFCSSICNYCNFNRGLFEPALKARYVDALEQEIRARRRRASRPTRSSSAAARRRCSSPTRSRASSPRAATRSTSTPTPRSRSRPTRRPSTRERLAAFRDAGVNRLSFGVQSFRDDELQRLGRHALRRPRARQAVGEARAAGFDNVSLDLMMWLPQQRVADWLETVEALIAVGPEHASLYLLELYPNAPLKETWRAPAGRRRRTTTRRRCTCGAWSGSTPPGIGSTRSRTSPARAPSRATTSSTGRTASGSGSAAARTRRAAASAGRTSSATEDYIARVAAASRWRSSGASCRRASALEEALFTGLRLAEGVDVGRVGARYGRIRGAASAPRCAVHHAGHRAPRRRPAPPDPRGHAGCERSDGGFRVTDATVAGVCGVRTIKCRLSSGSGRGRRVTAGALRKSSSRWVEVGAVIADPSMQR